MKSLLILLAVLVVSLGIGYYHGKQEAKAERVAWIMDCKHMGTRRIGETVYICKEAPQPEVVFLGEQE